jgi:hypothetical protein
LLASSDAFRYGALSKSGFRVLGALAQLGSVTGHQLRRALPGMHRSTVAAGQTVQDAAIAELRICT